MSVQRIVRHRDFDSTLSQAEAPYNCSTLCVFLNIRLRFVDPPRGRETAYVWSDAQTRLAYQRWQQAEVIEFRRDLPRVVEHTWNDRLWLTPSIAGGMPTALRRELSHPTLRDRTDPIPHAACRLHVAIVDPPVRAHASIRVLRLTDAHVFQFRSYVVPRRGGQDTGTFGDTDTACSEDGTSYEDAEGNESQCTAAHEVGHLLGLDHPVCRGNQDRCYGYPGSPVALRLMGRGNVVTASEGRPWARRMPRHTPGYDNWSATAEAPRHDREFQQWLRDTTGIEV